MEMLLTGDMIDAERAVALGLVNRAVPAGELDASVNALASKIAAKSGHVIALGKAAFYRQIDLDTAAAYAYASEVMTRNMLAADAAEGIDAFLGKREAQWRGC
jgi:enoyl-CoA hydratase/carnithine racemase